MVRQILIKENRIQVQINQKNQIHQKENLTKNVKAVKKDHMQNAKVEVTKVLDLANRLVMEKENHMLNVKMVKKDLM